MAGARSMPVSDKTWDRLNVVFWTSVAVILPPVLYLYCSGFCFSELRYLEDKDLIARAVHYNAWSMGIEDNPQAIQAFLKAHPDCCAVNRNGMASGFRSVEVELNYKVRLVKGGEELPYYRQYVEITSCGTRGEMYGEHTEILKRPGQI